MMMLALGSSAGLLACFGLVAFFAIVPERCRSKLQQVSAPFRKAKKTDPVCVLICTPDVLLFLMMFAGYASHTPEMYLSYFLSHGVTDVIRLNNKVYNASRFTSAGIAHHDLYFIDGSVPTDDILARFLNVSEEALGAIAVHCKGAFPRPCDI